MSDDPDFIWDVQDNAVIFTEHYIITNIENIDFIFPDGETIPKLPTHLVNPYVNKY